MNKNKLNFAIVFLVLNLAFAFIIIYLGAGYRFIHLNLAVVLGTIFYIVKLFSERKSTMRDITKPSKEFHFNKVAFMLLFVIFYTVSIYSLSFTNYTRPIIPIWYFVFISLAVAITGIEILFVRTKGDIALNFLKSLLITLSLRFSRHIITGGSSESDAPYHIYGICKLIIENSHLSNQMGIYAHYPALHIINAEAALIGSTDIWMTWCYLTTFIAFLGVFFAFLLGRKFINVKVGLFAALLFAISDYLIGKSLPQPMSLTTMLFLLIAYLLLSSKHSPRTSWSLLVVLTFPVLILAHHHSTALFIIFLMSLIIIQGIRHLKPNIASGFRSYNFALPVIIFITCLISYWIYVSGTFGYAITIVNFFVEHAVSHPAEASDIIRAVPLDVKILNEMGFCFLIVFATFGLLHAITKAPTAFRLAVVFSMVGYGGLIVSGYFFSKFVTLLPARIFTLVELFMIFLAAEAISLFEAKNKKRILLLAAILVLMSFFMTADFYACQNSSPIVFNNFVPVQATQQNFVTSGARWIGENLPYSKISYNETNSQTWDSVPTHNIYGSIEEIYNEDYIIRLKGITFDSPSKANVQEIPQGSYIVFDKELIYYGQGSGLVLSPDVINSFSNCDKLYMNDMISVYRKA